MGGSVSRPSCLGEKKSPRPEDALKEPYWPARNAEEEEEEDGGAGSPEKACLSPPLTENGWNGALEGAAQSSPLPKQNNVDLKLQNCCPLQSQQEGKVAPWTSEESLEGSRGRKLRTTREVTEVTEVTETVVTEIVEEVTKFSSGDRSQEAPATRMVKVLPDVREALPQVNRHRASNVPPSALALALWAGTCGAALWLCAVPVLPICCQAGLQAQMRGLWLSQSWGGRGR